MKQKGKVLGILGLFVPVVIAAATAYSEEADRRKTENELAEMKERITKLENGTES